MLRILLNILLLILVIRLFRPAARAVGRYWQRTFGPQKTDRLRKRKKDYSDLTPYEIEDADYEEIHRDRGRS